MASNYTSNYGLCQWEATDKVVHTEFNEDNAKLEATLHELAIPVGAYKRMAYQIYCMHMNDYASSGIRGYRGGLFLEAFQDDRTIQSMTDGVTVQDGALVLTGTGKTGTMTTVNVSIYHSGWTKILAWVKYSLGGIYDIAVNGVSMTKTQFWSARSTDGIHCQEFQAEGELKNGPSSISVSLTLNTGSSSEAKVYEYGVMFF